MARLHRDVEVVRTFWKMFARDEGCPWVLRVYCVNNLALCAGMMTELPPLPGIRQLKIPDVPLGISAELPTEVDVAAANAVAEVKTFLKQIGGANGDPQT